MRLLKPLMAGAALFALAAPALASAEPFYGGGGYEYHRNGDYNGRWREGGYAHRDRGYGGYGRRDYWDGSYGYGYHHQWRTHRDWQYDRGW